MSDADALTADLREVALLAGQPQHLATLLDSALDALAEVIPFDLAAVLTLDGAQLVVRA
ncbi:MAG: hypothetical protein H0W72_17780, partial [Planctomycetes bacterium]|nr:hypothetical protein [Planctomycetota bacterium]